jgi:A/G-specific adenine glycosylase
MHQRTAQTSPDVPPTSALLSPGRAAGISAPLLQWFRAEQRDLPWRRNPDPYAIWVSEVMLQQTQVATVIPYFELWMARFPTIRALAEAAEDEVLHAWQGLGYYSRARNLLRGAQAVLQRHHGRIPDRVEDLLALPGVGQYTAGAIASIAYNVSAPIVDGNVIRVLSRLFALRGDPHRAPLKGRLWELAGALIPEGEAREFNPALMELGATLCTPVNPRCGSCPVAAACEARRLGIQEELPETAARPRVTPVHMVAGLVWRSGRVLIAQRRADESRWAGMWQFPNTEVRPGETAEGAVRRAVSETVGLETDPADRATLVRHSVTRYRITLEAFPCPTAHGEPQRVGCQAWSWVCPAQLGDYALPAAHRAIARRALDGESQLHLSL